jgi:hypothetical protein
MTITAVNLSGEPVLACYKLHQKDQFSDFFSFNVPLNMS